MKISLEMDKEHAQTVAGMVLQCTRGLKPWRKTDATEFLDRWAIDTLKTIATEVEKS